MTRPRTSARGENVGVRLGGPSGGLVDVDLDCDEAVVLALLFLPTTATFGRTRKPRYHWLYTAQERDRSKKPPNTGIELRSNGLQTIVPPSIHVSGEPITWTDATPVSQVPGTELVAEVRKNFGTFGGLVRLPAEMAPSRILSLACLAAGLLFPITASAASWTNWVSEEGGSPPAVCGISEAARGFDCRGAYCDDVRLYCDSLPFGISVGSYNFTPFYSEEDSGIGSVTSEGWYRSDNSFSEVCYRSNTAGILTGIRCSGHTCDNISLECAIPQTNFEGVSEPVEYESCYWTEEYSEEEPPFYAAYGDFITGVECNGSYCDNKRYFVCTAQAAANSCEGSCGGQARGGCFCDAQCSAFGDCCSDEATAC